MNPNQPDLIPQATPCLRCGQVCRIGTPDPKTRMIRRAAKGFCPNCILTRSFLCIELIRELIEGQPQRGSAAAGVIVPARKGLGPEIFLNRDWMDKTLRPVLSGVLAHTQLREEEINWIEVVGNWGLPWPKGRKPKNTDL